MKSLVYGIVLLGMMAFSTYAVTLKVAKSGGDFTTIQAAVDVSIDGDIITIMDNEIYNEQVTIDNTKRSLTLTSKNPTSLAKPCIKWQDKTNIGPRTYIESQADSLLTFQRNGALRIIGCRDIIIDGITIDGVAPYIFGYPAIWNQKDPLQSGNTGIVMLQAGNVTIRNCDISNAYFGIYVIDRNPGGIFSQPNPADIDTSPKVPLSGFALTGSHIFEYNRIHNNSFGLFFESTWDLGSTIRYNLIYENHHATDTLAQQVKALTSDGGNQPGGAFFFRDILLSPLAIYNNTFYRNNLIFVGHWRAGYQHLVFNNIFGKPFKYWSDATNTFGNAGSSMEITTMMPNRITNCVFSCQQNAPQASYVSIMNMMPNLQGDSGASPAAGTVISGAVSGNVAWLASAENRWLEMDDSLFLSVNTTSASFLEPNWNNNYVKQFISQKGWQKSGVKNTDGSRADLGAIEQLHGRPLDVASIQPGMPVLLKGGTGTSATIKFSLDIRLTTSNGIMTNPTVTHMLYRYVNLPYNPGTDPFGNDAKTYVIRSSEMTDLTIPLTPMKLGNNNFAVEVPVTSKFGLIEMFIQGTGSDGKLFTSSAGFLPYRNLEYMIDIQILDTATLAKKDTVKAGETVVLRLTPKTSPDGNVFKQKLSKVNAVLQSGSPLFMGAGPDSVELKYPDGITGLDDKKIIITRVPVTSNIENITVSGTWYNSSTNTYLALLGTKDVFIIANTPQKVTFEDQISKSIVINPTVSDTGNWFKSSISARDGYGNKILSKTVAIVRNLSPAKAVLVSKSDTVTVDSGNCVIMIKLTAAAKENDTVSLQVKVIARTDFDTVGLIIGKPATVAVKNPMMHANSSSRNFGPKVLATCYDLQGRILFRKSFVGMTQSAIIRTMRDWKGAHASKVYFMEIMTNDKMSQRPMRTIQKIVVR